MRVAIVGATGAVGTELLQLLEERRFPLTTLTLYASTRSAGRSLVFRGRPLVVQALPDDGNLHADVVFSSAGGSLSLAHARNWARPLKCRSPPQSRSLPGRRDPRLTRL